MLLFRSEDHVERSGKPRGDFMSTEQMWRLAEEWYGGRADPSWRRRTADEGEAIFASIGLTGDFWRLRT